MLLHWWRRKVMHLMSLASRRGRARRLGLKLLRRCHHVPRVEALEDRPLLTTGFTTPPGGVQGWIEGGPGPTLRRPATGQPSLPAAGAIQAIVTDPDNADVIYVGAV